MKLAPIGEVGPEGEAGEGDAPRVAPHVGAGRDPARGFRDIADSCQQLPRCAATTRGRRERGDKGQRYAFSPREAACLHSGAEAAGFFSFQQGTDEGGIATSIPAVGRSPVHGGGLLLSPPNPCPPLPASRSGRSPPLRSRAAPSPPLRALSLTVFPPPSLLHPRLPFRPGRRGARPPPPAPAPRPVAASPAEEVPHAAAPAGTRLSPRKALDWRWQPRRVHPRTAAAPRRGSSGCQRRGKD